MPNVDAPLGFIPVRTLDGSPIKTRPYEVDSSNARAIGVGDLIVLEADGNVTRAAASPADGTVIGSSASKLAASTAGTILVYDNPMIVYQAQTDNGTGTGTSQAAVGANFNVLDTAPSNGVSQQEIDESTAATTATLPFKVLGLYKEVGNAFGEFNRLEVIINNHALRGGTGTGI